MALIPRYFEDIGKDQDGYVLKAFATAYAQRALWDISSVEHSVPLVGDCKYVSF